MNFIYTPWGNRVVGTLLIIIFSGALGALSWHSTTPSLTQNLYTYTCNVHSAAAGSTLKIRNVMSNFSIQFADQLCQSDKIHKSGIAKVEISWPSSEQLTAQLIINQEYNFVFSRHHYLKGLSDEVDSFYQPILSVSGFRIVWWHKGKEPVMTQEFFANKTIGVTNNTNSHFSYLTPLSSLANANITLQPSQLKYFPTSGSLQQGFINGDVDLIMWDKQLLTNLSPTPDIKINHSKKVWRIKGLDWYASQKSLDNKELICEFIEKFSVYEPLFATKNNLKLQNTYEC